MSLSARRAWIEIPAGCWRDARRAVALRKESVDRNQVAVHFVTLSALVALRKESVDRNATITTICTALKTSLSARRAWIEIVAVSDLDAIAVVALRKESVDRNGYSKLLVTLIPESLSARRAWIEIILH